MHTLLSEILLLFVGAVKTVLRVQANHGVLKLLFIRQAIVEEVTPIDPLGKHSKSDQEESYPHQMRKYLM